MGDEDGVLDCKDELLNIQEEYLQDEIDRESLQKLAPTRAREAEKEKKVKLIVHILFSWLLARFLDSISLYESSKSQPCTEWWQKYLLVELHHEITHTYHQDRWYKMIVGIKMILPPLSNYLSGIFLFQANNNSKGFEVKGAPWQGASDDAFPTLGGGGGAAASTPVWGPRR